MSIENSPPNPSKAASKPVAGRALNVRHRALLYGSLVLNCVGIAAVAALIVLCNVRTYWFSSKLHGAYQRTCPSEVAERTTTKKSGDTMVNTYYVSSKALESGCADQLMQTAQLDDYRAYPSHAKTSADMFRQLTPSHTLNITVVKSAENNTQLAPLQAKQ